MLLNVRVNPANGQRVVIKDTGAGVGGLCPPARPRISDLFPGLCRVSRGGPAAPAPRRDRKVEAAELAHLLTHKPANPHCVSCMRGKLRHVPHRSGAFARPIENWGDLITCDHMVQTDEDWTIGCDGSKNLLSIKDLATGLKWAYPMSTKSTEHTVNALSRFCGSYRIGCVYSDGAPELDEACRILGYLTTNRTPEYHRIMA